MKNGYCFLTDRLPIDILGQRIDTRACTAIAITLKLRDESSIAEKLAYISGKLFGKSYDTILTLTGVESDKLDSAIVSYIGGAETVKSWAELNAERENDTSDTSSAKKGKTNQDFDFVQDSEAIIASFRQVYGLSLDQTCDLHWWEFLALFRNLPPEGNTFSIIRDIRNRKIEKNDTPEQVARLKKAKRQVALKDTRSPEQKAKDREGMFDNIDL